MIMGLVWVENGYKFRFLDLTGLDGHLQPINPKLASNTPLTVPFDLR